jgi:colicin import membrane protein
LPTNLSRGEEGNRPKPRHAQRLKRPRKINDKTALQAAQAYQQAERRRESARRKEEVARAKERKHREQATAKAQAAFEKAQREHESRVGAIEADRTALERRSQSEDARWEKQRRKLQGALRHARE